MPKKSALITGITGQDGAYLAEFLIGKGYVVHGIKCRTSLFNTDRIDHLYKDPHEKGVRFFLHHGDMTDGSSLTHIIQKVQPDEIYNLAAQSHVQVSFEEPEYTANSGMPQWAFIDRMLTMAPGARRAVMSRIAPCIRKNGARALIAKSRSQSARSAVRKSPRSVIPAAFTSPSIRPIARSASRPALPELA